MGLKLNIRSKIIKAPKEKQNDKNLNALVLCRFLSYIKCKIHKLINDKFNLKFKTFYLKGMKSKRDWEEMKLKNKETNNTVKYK